MLYYQRILKVNDVHRSHLLLTSAPLKQEARLLACVPAGPTHLLEEMPESIPTRSPSPPFPERYGESSSHYLRDSGFCSCLSTGDQCPRKRDCPWCSRNRPEESGLPQQLSGDTSDAYSEHLTRCGGCQFHWSNHSSPQTSLGFTLQTFLLTQFFEDK